jgi:hypothetical protein
VNEETYVDILVKYNCWFIQFLFEVKKDAVRMRRQQLVLLNDNKLVRNSPADEATHLLHPLDIF